MPSNSPESALRDILRHIDPATRFAAEHDSATFREDERTVYAVTRCLEIISEASRRLPEDLKGRHPTIEWKSMAGAGNIYRHDYEDVAARYIWETTQRSLPSLRLVVIFELQRLEQTL